MHDDFPKVDLSERKDLDHVLDQVKQHAFKIVKEELTRAGQGKDRKAEKACAETIVAWIKAARQRLEPNVTINGMPFKEDNDGAEAFDQALSQRVQHLSERADTLTAEAIAARKTIPARRAELVKARTEALDRIGKSKEQKRRTAEEAFEHSAEKSSTHDPIKLDRSEEVGSTLRTAAQEIDQLAVSLLEQTSAAHEQANFVKRLRIMSASYR